MQFRKGGEKKLLYAVVDRQANGVFCHYVELSARQFGHATVSAVTKWNTCLDSCMSFLDFVDLCKEESPVLTNVRSITQDCFWDMQLLIAVQCRQIQPLVQYLQWSLMIRCDFSVQVGCSKILIDTYVLLSRCSDVKRSEVSYRAAAVELLATQFIVLLNFNLCDGISAG